MQSVLIQGGVLRENCQPMPAITLKKVHIQPLTQVVVPEEKYAQPGAERRILFLPEKLT